MKINYVFKHFTGTILFFAIIFVSAGHLDYLPGLIYAAIGTIMFILNYTALRIDPELSKERARPGEDTESWDKRILGVSFITLQLNLEGYEEYSQKTKYRLIPYIW